MNLNKIIFSLILLTSLSPALGMEGIVKDEVTKPKLVDPKVEKVVNEIKRIAGIEIESGDFTANLPAETLWKIVELSLTQPESVKIQANIILELLSDTNFDYLYSLLIEFIQESDQLLCHTYPLAIKLGYPQELQEKLKPTISKAVLKAFTTMFSDNPNISEKNTDGELLYDDEILLAELRKSFTGTGLDGNDTLTLCSLLTPEDFETLIHHMFDVDPINFSGGKMAHVLLIYNAIVKYSTELNVDLNFENKNGITPLMWTTLYPNKNDTLRNLTWDLQQSIIFSGADIDYTTKEGSSFQSVENEYAFNFLMYRIAHFIQKQLKS